ncbi:hypothetical protein RCL1_001167 [Eukaryota sp. TZLM3-RCL]
MTPQKVSDGLWILGVCTTGFALALLFFGILAIDDPTISLPLIPGSSLSFNFLHLNAFYLPPGPSVKYYSCPSVPSHHLDPVDVHFSFKASVPPSTRVFYGLNLLEGAHLKLSYTPFPFQRTVLMRGGTNKALADRGKTYKYISSCDQHTTTCGSEIDLNIDRSNHYYLLLRNFGHEILEVDINVDLSTPKLDFSKCSLFCDGSKKCKVTRNQLVYAESNFNSIINLDLDIVREFNWFFLAAAGFVIPAIVIWSKYVRYFFSVYFAKLS